MPSVRRRHHVPGLRRGPEGHFGLTEADLPEKALDLLGERRLLGLALGLAVAGDLHPLVARDRFQDTWAELLTELATARPTVLVLEDLHWAEQPLLDLIEWLLQRVEAPLVVIATARPESREQRPALGTHAGESVIVLDPLSPVDSARLVDELLTSAMPDQLAELVVDRSDGNPFVLEELVRMLIDRGQLTRTDDTWSVVESASAVDVPDSVQALVAARIDLLVEADKEALQTAAVIGRVFWTAPVYDLLSSQPDFRVLEERDFIRLQPRSSIPGQREYAIKHALTRDVAYSSLPRARRAHLHAAFAAWLERFAGDNSDQHAALLAHHYAEAVRAENVELAWADAEPELASLRAKAVNWLRRAADLAAGRYEIDEALSLLHRAAAIETDAEAERELWRTMALLNATNFNGPGFAAAMERAISLVTDDAATADLYAELAFQSLVRWGMWVNAPASDVVDGWIERALALSSPDSEPRAKALIARCYYTEDKSAELAAEAREIAERLGEPVLRSYGYDVQGLVAFANGDYTDALEWHRRRVSLVDEISDADHRADIYLCTIATAVACGRFEEARGYSESHDWITRGLSPHHRLHGVYGVLMVEELLGTWNAARLLTKPRRRRGRGEPRDSVRDQPTLVAHVRAGQRAPRRTRRGGRLEEAAARTS